MLHESHIDEGQRFTQGYIGYSLVNEMSTRLVSDFRRPHHLTTSATLYGSFLYINSISVGMLLSSLAKHVEHRYDLSQSPFLWFVFRSRQDRIKWERDVNFTMVTLIVSNLKEAVI
jgi:hypothetical protein